MPTGEKTKILWKNLEYRKMMSEARKGRVGYWKGKKMSMEHRKKIGLKGILHPFWKGGKCSDKRGRIFVYSPQHPFKDKRNYVPTHRLVMEKHIGRYLKSTEIIHHIDKNPRNNHISNLKICSRSEHMKIHLCK